MSILEMIAIVGEGNPNAICFENNGESLTYGELWEKSDRLALFLNKKLGSNKEPIMVYGHKHPMMLVCFLACVKSGRAYCPVDISTPKERVLDIGKVVNRHIVLGTVENIPDFDSYMGLDELKRIVDVPSSESIGIETGRTDGTEKKEPTCFRERAITEGSLVNRENWLKPEDTYYIIFTSGSTGKPKGVEITLRNLTNFVTWSKSLVENSQAKTLEGQLTFMNQAPFSFDLSVMDLYTCLATGGRLYSIDKSIQKNPTELLQHLSNGKPNIWVSTPSFLDMVLAEDIFREENYPFLKTFILCGEKFSVSTFKKIKNSFPNATCYNTYGPTESTVAVTSVKVNELELGEGQELPIGVTKPGTKIYIMGEQGELKAEGVKGEIVIAGDTVGKGYYMNPSKTEEFFIKDEISSYKDKNYKLYRTGDEGYLKGNMYYCSGRLDFQVKLHGYRIELGDIESNLCELDGIKQACVLPRFIDDKVRSLTAFVVDNKVSPDLDIKSDFNRRNEIRTMLKDKLPDYMVPKKILFLKALPMTNNGKVDRKKLEAKV